MAKPFGRLRTVQPIKDSVSNRNLYYRRLRTGLYDVDNSTLSDKTGAFVLYMRGHNYHIEEIEAANALANAGINVELRPEGVRVWATKVDKDNEGYTRTKYAEGVLGQVHLYDQRTVSADVKNIVNNVNRAINHAAEKNAKVAVIYDRYGMMHREDVEQGMSKYQEMHPKKLVDAVLVVNSKGNIYEHKFNKKDTV